MRNGKGFVVRSAPKGILIRFLDENSMEGTAGQLELVGECISRPSSKIPLCDVLEVRAMTFIPILAHSYNHKRI